MTDYTLARRNMVNSQLRTSKVTNAELVAAMGATPREVFVPPGRRSVAYIDEALPLGSGRWLSAPLIAARLYQLAAPSATDLVLLVGAGTGYGAAILGQLASALVALESQSDLVAAAETALAGVEADNVVVAEGNLADGWQKQAPYDVIVIEGAVEQVPDSLLAQLAPEGRLVAAVIGANGVPVATVLQNTPGGVAAQAVFDANVPSLAEFDQVREFVF